MSRRHRLDYVDKPPSTNPPSQHQSRFRAENHLDLSQKPLHQPFDIDTCCKCYKCYKPNIGFIAFVSQPFQSQIQLSHNHSSRFVVVVDNVVVVVELVIGEVLVVENVAVVVVVSVGVVPVSGTI